MAKPIGVVLVTFALFACALASAACASPPPATAPPASSAPVVVAPVAPVASAAPAASAAPVAPAASTAAVAPTKPAAPAAPANVVVRVDQAQRGRCVIDEKATAPCGPGESCAATIEKEVACPPAEELLEIDLQETFNGRVTVKVDGVVVLTKDIRTVGTTGLSASASVRPRAWPATVEIVAARTAPMTVRATKDKRFVGVSSSGGKLSVKMQAAAFGYD